MFGALLLVMLTAAVAAQEANISVPDVTGMNAPQAAAALNAVGLRLGSEANVQAADGQAEGMIASQNPASGERAVSGSAVDVTVARAPNIRLIYDDNDLTLINLSSQPLALAPLTLNAVQGGQGVYRAARWGAEVRAGDCVQVWSIGRGEPKSVDGCRAVNAWLTTNDTSQHVWTRTSGVRNFTITQDGEVRAECESARRNTQDTPMRCEFYVDTPADVPNLPYIYTAYTTDALIVLNPSDDGWLRLNVEIVGAGGEVLALNAATNYDSVDPLIKVENASGVSIRQLAPGQCVRFRAPETAAEAFPQPCVPYADSVLETPFWLADFNVRDRENKDHTRKAATPGRLTICVMPR